MRTDPDLSVGPSAEFYPKVGKRLLDCFLAGFALLCLSPLLVLLAILVRIMMGTPVLFRQERPGLGGKPFTLYKFRSMIPAEDAKGRVLSDDERLTRFGRLLRSTSLDELPELFNILRGDMSLVGPRPLLMRYLPLYTRHQARRHEVKPGLSGWAQISGRNFISISKRVELDVWYVDHMSFLLDLRIILLTVPRVLSSRSVSVAEPRDTMDLGLEQPGCPPQVSGRPIQESAREELPAVPSSLQDSTVHK